MLVRVLSQAARAAAHAPGQNACRACGQGGEVLAERADGVVVRHGRAVAKAHAVGTDPEEHRLRIAVAGHPRLAGILLPPIPGPRTAPGGRPLSAWPYGSPVDPADPGAAPWEETGVLLARLHTVPPSKLPGVLPPMRGPAKAAAAVARMIAAAGGLSGARAVLDAWHRLPGWARDAAPAPRGRVCHGDLHLGQLVRYPADDGPWLLIDVDDLGLGDPAWDLARPAAWFAAGLLAPDVWNRFLTAYRASGGPAVPQEGDPWARLDVPARALTVQTAAVALAKCATEQRDPDDVEQSMIDACARIAALPPELGA
ncbi:phosphotransferase family protein [Streptomyces sp. NPDC059176]|uniref:phosphotransferase family protein n=1 Tax=unclassified Streptomyces TaxID=2593676 RepID=UPI0036AEF599